VTGEPRPLEPGVDTAAFRIIQEALTNATRYTPRPGVATVSLRWSPTTLEIEVVNPLTGRHAPTTATLSTGHGLILMRERARSAGGTLSAGAADDGTFVVRASLPTDIEHSAGALESSTHA
jgi:signal transduction histidine kinase